MVFKAHADGSSPERTFSSNLVEGGAASGSTILNYQKGNDSVRNPDVMMFFWGCPFVGEW